MKNLNNNKSGENIAYLDYSNSAVEIPVMESSSDPISLANLIQNGLLGMDAVVPIGRKGLAHSFDVD